MIIYNLKKFGFIFGKILFGKVGYSKGDFSECYIDIGSSHNAPRGKVFKKKFSLPGIYIDADIQALEKLPIDKSDLKLNCAISSESGVKRLNLYQQGTHSLLEANVDEIEKYIEGYTGKPAEKSKWTAHDHVFVPTLRLSDIVNTLGIRKIAALKIDTQGHDLEVIKGGHEILPLVNYVEMEVQICDFEVYKKQSKKQEILEYMASSGFELALSERQTYDQEENLYFINSKLTQKEKDFYLVSFIAPKRST